MAESLKDQVTRLADTFRKLKLREAELRMDVGKYDEEIKAFVKNLAGSEDPNVSVLLAKFAEQV